MSITITISADTGAEAIDQLRDLLAAAGGTEDQSDQQSDQQPDEAEKPKPRRRKSTKTTKAEDEAPKDEAKAEAETKAEAPKDDAETKAEAPATLDDLREKLNQLISLGETGAIAGRQIIQDHVPEEHKQVPKLSVLPEDQYRAVLDALEAKRTELAAQADLLNG